MIAERVLPPVAFALGLLLLGVGCTPAPSGESLPPQTIVPGLSTLRLEGSVRGPVRGLGPSVHLEAWVRADGWVRCDLRFEDEEGRPGHEVLVWGHDTAILFDRRRGRFAELGEEAGRLDALGIAFRSAEAIWVALGKVVVDPDHPAPSWRGRDGEWRGSTPDRGWRRPQGEPPGWWELVWRDEEDRVHAVRATPEKTVESAWGRVPSRLSLDGDDLEGRLVAEWTVESFPALGDTIFDPLWEPPGR